MTCMYETESVTFPTALKTAKAFFSGNMFMNAFIHPQPLFCLTKDVELQK